MAAGSPFVCYALSPSLYSRPIGPVTVDSISGGTFPEGMGYAGPEGQNEP